MNAIEQLAEYRKRQAERFKDEEDDEFGEETKYEVDEIQQLSQKYDEEERKRQELRDMEYSQRLEREMNFRESYGRDDLEENRKQEFEDDIGDEGIPAQLPIHNQYDIPIDPSINYSDHERETYVKQDPPKWLLHPVHVKRDAEIK